MNLELPQHDQILVLDFGSQYTQLIARRLREMGAYCTIAPFDADLSQRKYDRLKGVILSGGPETVTKDATPRVPDFVLESGKPVLGICYGLQAMAEQLGGMVESSPRSEFGQALLRQRTESPLFRGVPKDTQVWMSHGDRVVQPPPGFTVLSVTENAEVAAMGDTSRGLYGVQFHPEVTHTAWGDQILRNFALVICGCSANWDARGIADTMVERARLEVGGERVLLALSGGVDSSVVAALLARAIGDRLTCVFVDNGLLRKNERTEVESFFDSELFPGRMRLECIDASELFLNRLQGAIDPERKRKLIGAAFIEVFEDYARQHAEMSWLAQGTIYPDVVESAATRFGKSHVIKSHHNVGGLPARLGLKLLEPLRDLFKDEVRALGKSFGLPDDLLIRHPFPGPGLGVRVVGEVTKEGLAMLRESDAIFIEELRKHDWYGRIGQAFAVLLPVNSVGVTGDTRRYGPVISLRAVETGDFMTAATAELPWALLKSIATRILNEVPGLSRVLLDVSSKPPATIEWE